MTATRKLQQVTDAHLQYRRKAFRDVRWFFEDFIKYPLLPWQYESIDAVLDVPRSVYDIPLVVNLEAKPRVSVVSCHGTGKTTWLAALAHIWHFIFVMNQVAVTAPKQDQLLRRFMPRYRDIHRAAPKSYADLINIQGRDVSVGGQKNWGVALETATDPESMAGYHDKPQLFMIDEASAKKLDPMFSTIEGSLTYKGSVIAEIGNPTRLSGEFYQHHNRKELEPLYFRKHVKYTDAPELISRQWVESMRIKYGYTSPIFKIRVLGEFATFDEATLIPLDYITEAYESELEPDGSVRKLRVAIDVSDGGEDDTCITACEIYSTFKHVKEQKSFGAMTPSEAAIDSALEGIKVFNQWGGSKEADEFVVDANGCGAGTAGYLIKQGYNVVRHVGGESSDDSDRWRNRRTQNHITCASELKEGRVRIDKAGIEDVFDFEGEMVSVKRAPGDETKVDDIQTAKSLKEELGFSPDKLNSLTMIFHGGTPEEESSQDGEIILGDSVFSEDGYM